jgi:hypothetical protein
MDHGPHDANRLLSLDMRHVARIHQILNLSSRRVENAAMARRKLLLWLTPLLLLRQADSIRFA